MRIYSFSCIIRGVDVPQIPKMSCRSLNKLLIEKRVRAIASAEPEAMRFEHGKGYCASEMEFGTWHFPNNHWWLHQKIISIVNFDFEDDRDFVFLEHQMFLKLELPRWSSSSPAFTKSPKDNTQKNFLLILTAMLFGEIVREQDRGIGKCPIVKTFAIQVFG